MRDMDNDLKDKNKRRPSLKKLRPPKRAMSAYVCYSHDVYNQVREELGTSASQPDIFSTIANRWRNMTDAQKSQYIMQAEQDKIRFNREDEEFKKNRKKWERSMVYLDDNNTSSNISGINKYLQQVMIQKDAEGLAHLLLTSNNNDVKSTCEILQTLINMLNNQNEQINNQMPVYIIIYLDVL